MSESVRMMIYTQDSYGLGHLRRATNFANALVSLRQDITILMVVDSPVAPFFTLGERIDFVKLPTVIKVDAGVFRPDHLSVEYDRIKTMRSHILRDIYQQFQPHLMLVDHMPGGANNELLPLLQEAHGTKCVLGLRDIIDDPEVTCSLWKRENVYDTMERYYDAVAIYSSPDFFPTAEKYQIPNTISKQVQYCGYVCNMNSVEDPSVVRNQYGLGTKPVITVMSGGGADGYRLMHTFLDAFEIMSPAASFSAMMVTGPFLSESHSRVIRKQSKKLDINVHQSIKDSMSLIHASDVVVSMAGYNTLSEILRFKKPAVVVPRSGPSAEQTMRTRIFSNRGLITALEQHALTPDSLAKAIVGALEKQTCCSSYPDMDGVEKVSDFLLKMI